jgi:hypothetical protein
MKFYRENKLSHRVADLRKVRHGEYLQRSRFALQSYSWNYRAGLLP